MSLPINTEFAGRSFRKNALFFPWGVFSPFSPPGSPFFAVPGLYPIIRSGIAISLFACASIHRFDTTAPWETFSLQTPELQDEYPFQLSLRQFHPMHYKIETEPIAGQKFSFTAHAVVKRARFQFYIDEKLVKESGCDDPPCHEFLDIHYAAAGGILKVRGVDESGEYLMQWEIGDMPMSKGGRRPRSVQGPALVTT